MSTPVVPRAGLPPFVVLTDARDGEPVSFWPHYTSTSCMHGLHKECKGKCKFCEERCRCACHKPDLDISSLPFEVRDSLADVPPGEQAAVSDDPRPALAELETRFTYHPPQPWQIPFYEEMRSKGLTLAEWVDQRLPDCREKALALTSIEQAIMWANAGMARRGTRPEEDHPWPP